MEIADIVKFSHERITDYDELYPVAQTSLEVMTLGDEGLKFRFKGSGTWIKLSGYTIEDVIDAAGAGDWCTAGIITTLFKNNNIDNLNFDNVTYALQFGQALSALNCIFEGARGLMYNINRNELLLSIQHIVNSDNKKIPQRNRPDNKNENVGRKIKISSLFASI